MPNPAEVISAPPGAEHGTSAQLQRFDQAARPQRGRGRQEGLQEAPVVPTEPPPLGQDLNAGLDEMLFSPTERPDEPITAGAPFGEGPDFVPLPNESTAAFMQRVGEALASSPASTPVVKRYLARINRGE